MDLIGLLGNLSIALIAIDVTVWSVSATLLSDQLNRNRIYLQRRISETENEIKDVQKSGSTSQGRITEIEKQIKVLRKEEKELQAQLFNLSLKGTVFLPCLFLLISLIAISASHFYPEHMYLTAGIALIMIIISRYRMVRTLRAIEFASTNIPLPSFDVVFQNGIKSLEIEPNKEMDLSIHLSNNGYDIGELIELSLLFPPDFKIHESEIYETNTQLDFMVFPSYTTVTFDLDILHVDTGVSFDLLITSPEEPKNYKILVYVNERNITQVEFELEIIVKPEV